jgi:hypothetical protein
MAAELQGAGCVFALGFELARFQTRSCSRCAGAGLVFELGFRCTVFPGRRLCRDWSPSCSRRSRRTDRRRLAWCSLQRERIQYCAVGFRTPAPRRPFAMWACWFRESLTSATRRARISSARRPLALSAPPSCSGWGAVFFLKTAPLRLFRSCCCSRTCPFCSRLSELGDPRAPFGVSGVL